ncbi:MAG TPA: NAD(P)/FAD-dependent oxidoreductase [Bacteroidales bacterium]|nr:NAD(P)/FAD-dependent oxidoreductase [Bacteroidales bacterium]
MDAQITIIGAGVVGLAIAEKLSRDFSDLFVIEKHDTFGQETSSRNSEVIHAGIYYPAGSLKARLCVEGKKLLYDYCKRYDVPYVNCGKLIVATAEDELDIIAELKEKAEKNGVTDLEFIGQKRIASLEPNIKALAALFSPSTGVVDSHLLMKRQETNIINNGGQIVYRSEVTGIKKKNRGYEITLTGPDKSEFRFTSRIVINSAGLSSDIISGMAGLSDPYLKIFFCKGEYFRLKPPLNRLLNRLVYPVPHTNLEGIGIHVTIDTAGGVKLGPDVTYLQTNTPDYSVNPSKRDAFYTSARKFLPFLQPDDISPDMAGIRPKIQRPGEPVRDFYIKEESERGLPGFINLIGIESPGLTSSPAIANYVENLIRI